MVFLKTDISTIKNKSVNNESDQIEEWDERQTAGSKIAETPEKDTLLHITETHGGEEQGITQVSLLKPEKRTKLLYRIR
ncbi:hypothetical protein DPMN_130448 [Dreissena polymorpha]|uniref:Uncharacterized protein n=1 Tax=Dreissena polymorpha TaxID=45954 RepID=A0A9D4H4P2_DREPO|nr:hypothetical protein DPMN_130448 [Dreissena polymorpha]